MALVACSLVIFQTEYLLDEENAGERWGRNRRGLMSSRPATEEHRSLPRDRRHVEASCLEYLGYSLSSDFVAFSRRRLYSLYRRLVDVFLGENILPCRLSVCWGFIHRRCPSFVAKVGWCVNMVYKSGSSGKAWLVQHLDECHLDTAFSHDISAWCSSSSLRVYLRWAFGGRASFAILTRDSRETQMTDIFRLSSFALKSSLL